MRSTPWALLLLASGCAAFGCQALRSVDGKPAGAGQSAMLDDVAVGQNRCPDPETGDARPFVVEWDATDLAGFEAKASRDLVFVKYEGCEIQMLYGCSDNGVPGRYGAYESPIFTSGTVESFEMRNQSEVYAKLPLGAATFAGKLEVGHALELLYFVSGAVNSTRNYVERAAISDNGRCAAATHFVSAYNLGAFRLLAHELAAGEVEGGVGQASVGTRTGSESSNLKQGGDLDSCETRGQQHCRVPIRLVLQAIDETSQDLDASAAGGARPNPEPTEDTVSERAAKLRQAAEDKGDAGDGAGCLADLDRADALDDSDETRVESLWLRSLCTMVAGNCQGGKDMLVEAISLADKKKKLSELQIHVQLNQAELAYCPLDQIPESLQGTAMFTRIRTARSENQPARCEANAEAALKLIRKQRKAGKEPDRYAIDALDEASSCLWSRGNCEAAKKWDIQSWVEVRGDKTEAEAREQAEQVWIKRHAETGCDN